jgi:hypothetical protein
MWGTEHLTDAAQIWTGTATVWEDCFTQLTTRIGFPGGTAWEGAAADAAFARAHGDRMIVIGLADELHAAARIARTGAGQIAEARRAMLRVVESAENAGFSVGEDFSVTCPGRFDSVTAAARQAQAVAFATELRATVGSYSLACLGRFAADFRHPRPDRSVQTWVLMGGVAVAALFGLGVEGVAP